LVFDPSSPWVSRWQDNQMLPISGKVIDALAAHLKTVVEKTPAAALREVIAGQMRQDSWLARSAVAGALNALHENPEILEKLDRNATALLRILDDAHVKVLLPWWRALDGKPNPARDQEAAQLRKALQSLEVAPTRAWLTAGAALSRTPELSRVLTELPRLTNANLEKLTVWLESDVPRRFLLWNRLMHVQNPDENASRLP
jgi:hypothetical protein